MSNDNSPRRRRSFRAVGKFFKFAILLLVTFIASFAATLIVKSDHPAELFGSVSEEFDYDGEPAQSTGAPEIKTLFDNTEVNVTAPAAREKISSDDEKSPEPERTARREENIGFFAAVNRMTDVTPAVEDKIRAMPHYVKISDIPYFMRQAVIAVEDTRFYQHKGFDLIGIARAVFVNAEAGEIREGASTITQQTVKNLFLTSDQTFTRKFEELILSVNMERNFSKDKILEIYLNTIYFGSDFYGIHDAAQGYFGKDPIDLTMGECAMLAGLPNAPSLYSPYVDFHRAKKRQLIVIDAMEKSGIITKTEAESARVEEIVLIR